MATLTFVTRVNAPIDVVWAFFLDPANLTAISPPDKDVRVVSIQPLPFGAGTRIEVNVRLLGPLRAGWVAHVTAFEPPHRFVDVQERGPFAAFHHEHRFEAEPGGTTRIVDVVTYAAPGGPFAPLVDALFVRRDLQSMFAHRARALTERFGAA